MSEQLRSDTSLLTWLEYQGYGYALISDDNGHWACVCDGVQNAPEGPESQDIQTTHFISRNQWKNSIRGAIEEAMDFELGSDGCPADLA